MRMLVVSSAMVALGCRGGTAPDFAAMYKFLPGAPDVAARIDVARVRGWPQYAKVAPTAVGKAQEFFDDVRRVCDLDLVAEMRTLVIAKRGSLQDGDLTLAATGLAKAKVMTCLATMQKASAQERLTIDGDEFHVKNNGNSLGSGAFLASGELVFVMRDGKGVEPAAWKAELAAPAGTRPDWWAEMNLTDAVSVRVSREDKHAVFSSDLGDPLLVHGTIVAANDQAAKKDLKTYTAIAEYLRQGDAGATRLELSTETIYTDITAKGPQIEHLIGLGLPAIFGAPPRPADPSTPPGSPAAAPACASLAAAVETYLKEGLSVAPAAQKATMAPLIPTLLPRLQKAFVDRCTADQWTAPSIQCHLANATQLPKFENCRNELTADQRDKLDKDLTTAMTSSPGAP